MENTLQSLTQSVAGYVMPPEAQAILQLSSIVMLCGVTGAGKNTIINYMLLHDNYSPIVSHTTRAPRMNDGRLETEGIEYFFTSIESIQSMVAANKFVEIKQVHAGQFSGTSIASVQRVLDDGKIPIKEINYEGAQEIMNSANVRALFVLPPSFDTWLERIAKRGIVSEHDMKIRMQSALVELEAAITDRRFLLVVNNGVEQTAEHIKNSQDLDDAVQAANLILAKELLRSAKDWHESAKI
jgi:guanylate kinase